MMATHYRGTVIFWTPPKPCRLSNVEVMSPHQGSISKSRAGRAPHPQGGALLFCTDVLPSLACAIATTGLGADKCGLCPAEGGGSAGDLTWTRRLPLSRLPDWGVNSPTLLSPSGVSLMRQDHRTQRSGPADRHQRWGQALKRLQSNSHCRFAQHRFPCRLHIQT